MISRRSQTGHRSVDFIVHHIAIGIVPPVEHQPEPVIRRNHPDVCRPGRRLQMDRGVQHLVARRRNQCETIPLNIRCQPGHINPNRCSPRYDPRQRELPHGIDRTFVLAAFDTDTISLERERRDVLNTARSNIDECTVTDVRHVQSAYRSIELLQLTIGTLLVSIDIHNAPHPILMHGRGRSRIRCLVVTAIIIEGPQRISKHMLPRLQSIDHHTAHDRSIRGFIPHVHPGIPIFGHEHRLPGISKGQGIDGLLVAPVFIDHDHIAKLRRVIVLSICGMRHIGHQPDAVQFLFDEPYHPGCVRIHFRMISEYAVLIANAPSHDGWMIVLLLDELRCIRAALWRPDVHVGRPDIVFCQYQHPLFVEVVHHILRQRPMRKPRHIGSGLLHQIDIFPKAVCRQGAAGNPVIRHPVISCQTNRLAIEQKSMT